MQTQSADGRIGHQHFVVGCAGVTVCETKRFYLRIKIELGFLSNVPENRDDECNAEKDGQHSR